MLVLEGKKQEEKSEEYTLEFAVETARKLIEMVQSPPRRQKRRQA